MVHGLIEQSANKGIELFRRITPRRWQRAETVDLPPGVRCDLRIESRVDAGHCGFVDVTVQADAVIEVTVVKASRVLESSNVKNMSELTSQVCAKNIKITYCNWVPGHCRRSIRIVASDPGHCGGIVKCHVGIVVTGKCEDHRNDLL